MAESNQKEGASAPVLPEYEVRGIFDVGYYEYNLSVIVTSLQDAQDLYDLGDSVHGLMVMLHDPYQAPAVASKELGRCAGAELRVTTWMQENSNLLDALVVEKNVMFYLLFFIMIVAALCILSALITFVVQKTREIGMLKALGATDLQVGLFSEPGGACGRRGRGGRFRPGDAGAGLPQRVPALYEPRDRLRAFPRLHLRVHRTAGADRPRDIVLICGSA